MMKYLRSVNVNTKYLANFLQKTKVTRPRTKIVSFAWVRCDLRHVSYLCGSSYIEESTWNLQALLNEH